MLVQIHGPKILNCVEMFFKKVETAFEEISLLLDFISLQIL